MKKYAIEAEFPELRTGHCRQSAMGEGTTIDVAVGRALAEIVAREGVKRKHITEVIIKVALIDGPAKPCIPTEVRAPKTDERPCACGHPRHRGECRMAARGGFPCGCSAYFPAKKEKNL